MDPALGIALLWLAFAAAHVGLSSHPLRGRLVAALGAGPFMALYSAIALGLFVPLVWLYFTHKHAGPALWLLPRGPLLSWAVYLGMGLALVLFVSSFVQPSPAGMAPASLTPHGVQRITRHPLVMSFALFGLVHLLPNGWASDVAFFGGFVAFALVGAAHQDRRKIATGPAGYAEFVRSTPFVPFTGRETLRGLRELSPLAVALGLGLALAIRYFHARWLGGNP
ncbi:MAG TPA: NnrU family protein [Myxococcota bacterium]|nr:NnrU family protein [Myxococcota bacterium]